MASKFMRERANRPIGIFDSGLGGLTVFKAVHESMPAEKLIYFGDTAHVPYGSKSPETVTGYSKQIAKFLTEKNIKLLVVACNTASALSLKALRLYVKVPVIGVIEPGARGAVNLTRNKKIAVIATEATTKSHAYKNEIHRLDRKPKVSELACPMLVPAVEEGWWKDEITRLIVKKYLSKLRRSGADTLILGCTHYPVIKNVIQKEAGTSVKIIDSAQAIASEVKSILKASALERRGRKAEPLFYASDSPERFKRLAKNILGKPLKKVSLKRFY